MKIPFENMLNNIWKKSLGVFLPVSGAVLSILGFGNYSNVALEIYARKMLKSEVASSSVSWKQELKVLSFIKFWTFLGRFHKWGADTFYALNVL